MKTLGYILLHSLYGGLSVVILFAIGYFISLGISDDSLTGALFYSVIIFVPGLILGAIVGIIRAVIISRKTA